MEFSTLKKQHLLINVHVDLIRVPLVSWCKSESFPTDGDIVCGMLWFLHAGLLGWSLHSHSSFLFLPRFVSLWVET